MKNYRKKFDSPYKSKQAASTLANHCLNSGEGSIGTDVFINDDTKQHTTSTTETIESYQGITTVVITPHDDELIVQPPPTPVSDNGHQDTMGTSETVEEGITFALREPREDDLLSVQSSQTSLSDNGRQNTTGAMEAIEEGINSALVAPRKDDLSIQSQHNDYPSASSLVVSAVSDVHASIQTSTAVKEAVEMMRPILVHTHFGTIYKITTIITNYPTMVKQYTGEVSEPGDISHDHMTRFVLKQLNRRGVVNQLGQLVISKNSNPAVTDQEVECVMQEYAQIWRRP